MINERTLFFSRISFLDRIQSMGLNELLKWQILRATIDDFK